MTNEKQIDKICRMLDDLIAKSKRDTNSEPAKEQLKSPDFYEGYKIGFESAQPKWISVEERLPEEEGIYIVYITRIRGDTFIGTDYYDFSNHWCGEGWYDGRCVTHWMPFSSLPEPPKVR